MGKNEIPDRWLPYSPMGSIITGTPFVACKVPLKESLLRKVQPKARFGTKDLIEAVPNMGLLVDLTNTTRYYFKQEITNRNIRYEKIFCPGHVIPPTSIVQKFFEIVDDFLAINEDPDAAIVVHCTHGVNRTGYFICRYMIEKLAITPEEAVQRFQEARGHKIERDNYVNDLKNGCKGGSEEDTHLAFKGNATTLGTNTLRTRGEWHNSGTNGRFQQHYDYGWDEQRNRNEYWVDRERQYRTKKNVRNEGTEISSGNRRDHEPYQNSSIPPTSQRHTHRLQQPSSYHMSQQVDYEQTYQPPKPSYQTAWRQKHRPKSKPSEPARTFGREPQGFIQEPTPLVSRPPSYFCYQGTPQESQTHPRSSIPMNRKPPLRKINPRPSISSYETPYDRRSNNTGDRVSYNNSSKSSNHQKNRKKTTYQDNVFI